MSEDDRLKKVQDPDVKKGWGDSVEFDPDKARRILPDLSPPPKPTDKPAQDK